MTEYQKTNAENPVEYTLRLRRTVLFGFMLLVALMSFLAILIYNHLSSANAGLTEITKVNNLKTELYYAMRIASRERIIYLHRMLQTDDPFERDELAQKHSSLAATFIRAREELETLSTDKSEMSLFYQLSMVLTQAQPLQTRVVELALQGRDKEANVAFIGATQGQERALVAIDRLLDRQAQNNQLRKQNAEKAYADATKYLLLIAVSMLIIGGLIAVYVWIKVGHASRALIKINQSLLEVNEGLAAATEKAEAASIAKSEFLSNISHELRTPMTSVLGSLGLLKEGVLGQLSDSANPMVEMAHRNSQKLLLLLNDLLDFSKIEAGKMTIHPGKCNLRRELDDIIELFAHQAADKELKLECRIDNTIEKYVKADASRVYQVLINLVGNAIKFTEKGGIVIDVQLTTEGDEKFICFRVIDSGIGVPEIRRHSIFDKFVQVDGSTTRTYGGTGLGLAICKQLVVAMSGKIGMDSPKEGGSIFWFTLPYLKW